MIYSMKRIVWILRTNNMKNFSRPCLFALIGFIFALPFIIMNLVVSLRLEPIYSFLGSIGVISASPVPLVPILVLLGLIGAVIAAWPMFCKQGNGRRVFYPLNALIALILLAGFVLVGTVLGEEIYRCEILQIPNCD